MGTRWGGHSVVVGVTARSGSGLWAAVGARQPHPPSMSFVSIYEENFDFVWRSLRRLGVQESSMDDATQDVFLVVHRRLADFGGRSSVRTWLFGIALRVAGDHRRRLRRKGGLGQLKEESIADQAEPGPFDTTARNEAVDTLDRLLEEMDEAKRAVFVLAELEQLTAPEIALALDVNVNTVYSRLRAARAEFENAVARLHVRGGRQP